MKSERERLFEFHKLLSPYKFRVLFSMILLVISTFCIVYAPKVAGQTVNFFLDGLNETNYEDVFYNLILLLGLYSAGYILKLPASRIMIFVGEKVAYDLRMKLYDGLVGAQLNNIYSDSSGNIVSRINNDLMNVRSFIISYLSEFLAVITTLILTIDLIISINIKLSLIYLGLMPILAIILYYFGFRSKPKYKKHQNEMGKLIGLMSDVVTNHIAIQAYNCQDYVEDKFEKINYDLDEYYKSSRFSTGAIPPFARLIINLGNILVYLYGVYMLINHEILLGTLLTVILYGELLIKPLLKATNIITAMETSLASLDRVLDIIKTPTTRQQGLTVIDKRSIKSEIEFKNVCYKDIINDFNLKINPGELVSITGPAGSGKSILMELLIRLYDIDSGEILLDGHNIYNIHPTNYNNIFGYVPTEKWIFEGTIAENIGYGVDKYTLDDVKNACKTIGFDEIIESLPNKYDTQISEEKNNLNNSEKELICIARATIRDPKILILDDVSIDINNIIEGKTTFIITDDERIINMSDKVIELNN